MGKFFKSLWRGVVMVFTFGAVRLDKASEKIASNPDVVDSEMKDIIETEIDNFNTHVSAIARYKRVAIQTEQALEKELKDRKRLQGILAGAKRQAEKRANELKKQGKSREEILADSEFHEHQIRARDFANTLKNMNNHVKTLEQKVNDDENVLAGMARDLERSQRRIDDLKRERGQMVANMVANKARKDAAQQLAGVSNQGTGERLQRLRDRVAQGEAEMQVMEGVARIDSKRVEEDYLDEVRNSEADDDFLNDVLGDYGLEDEAVATPSGNGTAKERVPFPEQ